MKEQQPRTHGIVNCRHSAVLSDLARIKVRCIMIGNRFEIGN